MIYTFGETMLRISPNLLGERIIQALGFRVEPGGSESNVAIALASLGTKTAFITSLPKNELSQIVLRELKKHSVDTSFIRLKGERIGIYWTETGVGPRSSYVIYDREQSAFSQSGYEDYGFDEILKNASWFHFSGISLAVSESVAGLLTQVAYNCPCPYSIDLNYRGKLWKWVDKDKLRIKKVMLSVCKKATLIAGNETDFSNVFGLRSSETKTTQYYSDIASQCFQLLPNARYISISCRKSQSATLNTWTGFLFVKNDQGFVYKGHELNIDHILDRVGTGDSFVAGIIYGLNNPERFNYQQTVDFAVALAALNHTTLGDASTFSESDVMKVIQTGGSGRIIR